MVILGWECPHNCADTWTCACDTLSRAIERNSQESDARFRAQIEAEYPERVRRIANCARQFLRCHDEFPDDPGACAEWLDALERAVDGSPAVRYDEVER